MDIEFEHRGIEELLNSDNDEYIPVEVSLKGKGSFMAYITPLTYGEVPKKQMTEIEMAQEILLNHIYKSDKTKFTETELKQLPAGWITEFTRAIMSISGFDETHETIKDF